MVGRPYYVITSVVAIFVLVGNTLVDDLSIIESIYHLIHLRKAVKLQTR